MRSLKRFAIPALAACLLPGSPQKRPDAREQELAERLRPFLKQLLAEYQSVGLFPKTTLAEFRERIRQGGLFIDEEEWLDASRAGPDQRRYFRQSLLGSLDGMRQDVRFSADDVLAQVRKCLNARGIALVWGKEIPGRQVVLRIDGGPQLKWRYGNAAGLVRGVNRLLQTAGSNIRFLEIASDGDYHLFACATTEIARRIAKSSLFQIHEEPDPLAQPIK